MIIILYSLVNVFLVRQFGALNDLLLVVEAVDLFYGLLVQPVHHDLQLLPRCREVRLQAGEPVLRESRDDLVFCTADTHYRPSRGDGSERDGHNCLVIPDRG